MAPSNSPLNNKAGKSKTASCPLRSDMFRTEFHPVSYGSSFKFRSSSGSTAADGNDGNGSGNNASQKLICYGLSFEFGSFSRPSPANDNNGKGSGANAGKKPVFNGFGTKAGNKLVCDGSRAKPGKKPVCDGTGSVSEAATVTMDASLWPTLAQSAQQRRRGSRWFSGSKDGSASSYGTQRNGGPASSKYCAGHNSSNNTKYVRVPQISLRFKEPNSLIYDGLQHQHLFAPPHSSINVPLNNPFHGDHSQRSEFAMQPVGTHDHPQLKDAYTNHNGGLQPHGEGSHLRNYGNNQNGYHKNQNWGSPSNFNSNYVHMQSKSGGPSFMMPSYTSPPSPYSHMPYAVPRLVAHPMTYHEPVFPLNNVPPLYQDMGGRPYGSNMPPRLIHYIPPNPRLTQKIVKQIDYYFSKENLVRDVYLREKMDGQGWVSIRLIAEFPKMRELTCDIQIIAIALQSSTNVEVQGDKIRKKDDWKTWIIPP